MLFWYYMWRKIRQAVEHYVNGVVSICVKIVLGVIIGNNILVSQIEYYIGY